MREMKNLMIRKEKTLILIKINSNMMIKMILTKIKILKIKIHLTTHPIRIMLKERKRNCDSSISKHFLITNSMVIINFKSLSKKWRRRIDIIYCAIILISFFFSCLFFRRLFVSTFRCFYLFFIYLFFSFFNKLTLFLFRLGSFWFVILLKPK